MIEIQRYAGREANVNSYLLSDAENVIVIDLLRNSNEAVALADHVEATGKKLACIFISHGHPDHYIWSRRLPAPLPGGQSQGSLDWNPRRYCRLLAMDGLRGMARCRTGHESQVEQESRR